MSNKQKRTGRNSAFGLIAGLASWLAMADAAWAAEAGLSEFAEVGVLETIDRVLSDPIGVAQVLAIEAGIGAALFFWLWRTRKDLDPAPAPGEEIRRYVALVIWLFVHTAVVFSAGSIFAHQDGAWYATSVAQSSIMPAHRLIFYLNLPAYIIIGGGAFLYAKTRLPKLADRSKLAFAIAVLAPFSFMPAFSSSFLDHSYDLNESVYVALYGLINVAWVILGMGTLLSRSLRRIAELTR